MVLQMIKNIILVSYLVQLLLADCEFNFMPMPRNCTVSEEPFNKSISDPCLIVYIAQHISDSDRSHIKQLLNHYQSKTFGCGGALVNWQNTENTSQYAVVLSIKDTQLKSAFSVQEQSYELNATNESVQINAQTYVGLVRGIETFSQLFRCSFRARKNLCNMSRLPIWVKDQPEFPYRGLMIDTARHFLPIKLILETVDALMYNKMNVLHWHITDEDSFPLKLDKHPELAQHGAFSPSEVYSPEEARQVVRYAMVRGVRVIPELDTPSHAASWSKAPSNKDYACNRGYMGTLDITLDGTYQLVRDVLQEIDSIFPDPVMHLGGDEVVLMCMTNRTAVLKEANISDNNEALELYYRRRQRQILKSINPNRKAMYWTNAESHTPIDEQHDIIHWWGETGFPQTQRKVVISRYGPHYLDMGAGSYLGTGYGRYQTWRDLYDFSAPTLKKQLEKYANNFNVLGAEVCLWSELSNKYTHHTKIWARTCSFAERLWNPDVEKLDVLKRIVVHEKLMNRKGIPTAPVTCRQCEFEDRAELCD